MARKRTIILLCLLLQASASPQVVFESPFAKRELKGRFLQITDIHPDPYYGSRNSLSSACHHRKPKKEKPRSSLYGTPYSECDSPFHLTNFTFDYLEKHWATEVDFVVWTGDNARHDNDRKLPRTPSEIYDLNRVIASKMESIFTRRGIPVIPSLGNNDVWPHNIMTAGPNSITNEFSSIWRSFIPFPSYQVFQRGAYFSVEVVPDALAVISLNTIYFYDSNKAVGGCEYKDETDPGNLQFDWLEVQLEMFRQRNIQVWLTGHVPPSSANYFPECYVRYAELSLRYQSTILGHLYGHMNADHFFFVEADDLEFMMEETGKTTADTRSRADLYDALLADYEALPSSSKTDDDEFAVINVSPPIVPNPYLPTFRVYSYNASKTADPYDALKRKHGRRRGSKKSKKELCKDAPYKDSWKCVLKAPWHSDRDSPSRMNRRWTPLGYAQFYIPHLERANKTHRPKFKLSYVTYAGSKLVVDEKEGVAPIPRQLLPRELRGGGNGSWGKYCPYGLDDLTVGSWLDLGRRLGDRKEKKLRKRYRRYLYLGRGREG